MDIKKILRIILFSSIEAVMALLLIRIAAGAMNAPLSLDWGLLLTLLILAIVFEAGITFVRPERSPFLKRYTSDGARQLYMMSICGIIAVTYLILAAFLPSHLTNGDLIPLYQQNYVNR